MTDLSKPEVMILINRNAAQFDPVPTLEVRKNHIRISRLFCSTNQVQPGEFPEYNGDAH